MSLVFSEPAPEALLRPEHCSDGVVMQSSVIREGLTDTPPEKRPVPLGIRTFPTCWRGGLLTGECVYLKSR